MTEYSCHDDHRKRIGRYMYHKAEKKKLCKQFYQYIYLWLEDNTIKK